MTAHYFATRTRKELVISRDATTRLESTVARFEVSGKIEARKLAAQHNAQPWNF